MTPEERPVFIAHLQAAAALFRRRLSEDVAEMYADALADESFDRLIAALDRLARTAESADRFPMPRELRQRARGGWHQPARNLTDAGADAVRQRVWAAMAAWERQDGQGSARPPFERAWQAALVAEGFEHTAALTAAREAAWQTWLRAGTGPPVPRDRMAEILRDAATRAAPGMAKGMRDLAETITARDHPTPSPAATPIETALVETVGRMLDAEVIDPVPSHGGGDPASQAEPGGNGKQRTEGSGSSPCKPPDVGPGKPT
jgi:hypothetical protein